MNFIDDLKSARTFYIPHQWVDRKIKIALIGLGGTGSAMLTELFQMSGLLQKLGHDGFDVVAYDGDTVSESNVFRQNFWQHDIGMNKAEVLINRFNQFGGLNWIAKDQYFDSDECRDNTFDLLITAVDKASVRNEIGRTLSTSQRFGLWLDLGNDKDCSNVLLGSQSPTNSKDRLPTPFELFGSQWAAVEQTEVVTDSCSHEQAIAKQTFGINGMTARSAASMLLFPLLRNGNLKHHGLFIDLATAEIRNMPVDPIQWTIYGYEE